MSSQPFQQEKTLKYRVGAARKTRDCYAGGPRGGMSRGTESGVSRTACGSGPEPTGTSVATRTFAMVGSMAWWLRWQIGQLSGAALMWWCQTIPAVVPSKSARIAIGSTRLQIRLWSDMLSRTR